MSDNLDRVLNSAGGAWRADQPPPPDVDTSRFLQSTHGPRARVWAPIAAVAGVAAVLAVVVLPIAFGGGGGAPLGMNPVGRRSRPRPGPAGSDGGLRHAPARRPMGP